MSQYVTVTDRALFGVNATAFSALSSEVIQAALDGGSDTADMYLRSAYVLPLIEWGNDLRRLVVHIADWDLMCTRGFNPEAPGDIAVRERRDMAIAQLKEVAAGRAFLNVTDNRSGAQQGEVSARPVVRSSSQRGWTDRQTTDPITYSND